MADKKISDLTAITGANTADDDLLVIVDTSAGETKRITLGELENGLARSNFALGDNEKITFGAGSDLQIYHDGSNSYVRDAGTGRLNLRSDGAGIDLQTSTGETMVRANVDGAVDLYYDNSKKLATTSTGIDITGDVAIGDGSNTSTRFVMGADTDSKLFHNGTDAYWINETGSLLIRNLSDDKDIALQTDDGSGGFGNYVFCDGSTGATQLYNNNSLKLATTSTGIDITGTVTADGLTVDAAVATITNADINNGATLRLDNATSSSSWAAGSIIGTLEYYLSADASTTEPVRAKIELEELAGSTYPSQAALNFYTADGNGLDKNMSISSGGDISFYEDTGTTAKLTWDASAESLNFADDAKAIFGAGSDLQIYHDGSHSRIVENGTGNLSIRASNFNIYNSAGTNPYLIATDGAELNLYHNGSAKLATTSTGIDVTGTVTADGLTVATNTDPNVVIQNTTSGASTLTLRRINADDAYTDYKLRTESGYFKLLSDDATYNDQKVFQASPDGDISFYEDTGTTPKFFWDASAESLGIGTSSPSVPFHISTNQQAVAQIESSNVNGSYAIWAVGGTKFGDVGSKKGIQGTGNTTDFMIASRSTYPLILGTGSTERMRIDSSGNLLVGKATTSISTAGFVANSTGQTYTTCSNDTPSRLNRLTSDGTLIVFYQDNTSEGSISVSGTTVSYNGGHLARWSQLADNTKDESIVKGTVLTNLDQMAVWHHEATEDKDAYTEDNEQLNCMAVSSVEGDPNVAGVFVNWDNDDDEFNDMNIAMTGDMVIRIAQGTTVQRGDLLMSAGDGTAKPQGDDIVRSKTIAKVTSTNVSHTYDDGSYLVPCVLMAC